MEVHFKFYKYRCIIGVVFQYFVNTKLMINFVKTSKNIWKMQRIFNYTTKIIASFTVKFVDVVSMVCSIFKKYWCVIGGVLQIYWNIGVFLVLSLKSFLNVVLVLLFKYFKKCLVYMSRPNKISYRTSVPPSQCFGQLP